MNTLFRCPFCLFVMSSPKGSDTAEYACAGCRQNFFMKDALPAAVGGSGEQTPEVSVIPESPGSMVRLWVLVVAISLLGSFAVLLLGKQIRGVPFAVGFLALGVVLFLIQFMVRLRYEDHVGVSVMALVVFETIGLTRLLAGYFLYDMRNFQALLIMMTIGGSLFFVRMAGIGLGGGGLGGVCSGSSSGSSCGGGGCGGGGCGGCGS